MKFKFHEKSTSDIVYSDTRVFDVEKQPDVSGATHYDQTTLTWIITTSLRYLGFTAKNNSTTTEDMGFVAIELF